MFLYFILCIMFYLIVKIISLGETLVLQNTIPCPLKSALSSLRQFLATESSVKMPKMLFMSPEKLFLFSRYFNFCLDILIVQKKGLIGKIRLISKFMMSQSGKQTIAVHILPNISRSRGTQTIKFGQLIEWNMRIIFLEISCAKCAGESVPRPFSKK